VRFDSKVRQITGADAQLVPWPLDVSVRCVPVASCPPAAPRLQPGTRLSRQRAAPGSRW
jgi:hypothetical protein